MFPKSRKKINELNFTNYQLTTDWHAYHLPNWALGLEKLIHLKAWRKTCNPNKNAFALTKFLLIKCVLTSKLWHDFAKKLSYLSRFMDRSGKKMSMWLWPGYGWHFLLLYFWSQRFLSLTSLSHVYLQPLADDGPVKWTTTSHLCYIAEQVSHHPPSE